MRHSGIVKQPLSLLSPFRRRLQKARLASEGQEKRNGVSLNAESLTLRQPVHCEPPPGSPEDMLSSECDQNSQETQFSSRVEERTSLIQPISSVSKENVLLRPYLLGSVNIVLGSPRR